jgi:hypothetical protein
MRSFSFPSVSSPSIRTDTNCSCPRHLTTSFISSGGAASATASGAAALSAGTGANEDEAASAMGLGCSVRLGARKEEMGGGMEITRLGISDT